MSSSETLNKNDRKEDLIVRLMQADANEPESINLYSVHDIAIKLEASKQAQLLMANFSKN
jgi:hypothetical protein